MYKIYENGCAFIEDNNEILNKNKALYSFMFLDAPLIDKFTPNMYAIKVYDKDKTLFLMNDSIHNTLVYGESSLSKDAFDIVKKYNLQFEKVLGETKAIDEICKASSNYNLKIRSKDIISMSLMKCEKDALKYDEVVKFKEEDISELSKLMKDCSYEINTDLKFSDDEAKEYVKKNLSNIRGIIVEEKIVSVAVITRETDSYAFISFVYTMPLYRNKSYARKVVSSITNEIRGKGKDAYLYVDDANPISNRLYEEIGYVRNTKIKEARIEKNYKSLLLAGGCFWCMAKPFYDFEGVFEVKSGYAGGAKIDPTYEEVKKGSTHHRETVKILYDPNVVTHEELIDAYFKSIDPFDGEGQFIDRGENYSCAIFSDDVDVINYYNCVVSKIEAKYKRKVKVKMLPESVFFEAEEYHQEYAIKFKDAFEEEERKSKRDIFKYIEIDD